MESFKNLAFGQNFQAVCQDCDFVGPIRSAQNEAEADAAGHFNDPLFEDHIVSIDVLQKSVVSQLKFNK
jgi:hypothetical protein